MKLEHTQIEKKRYRNFSRGKGYLCHEHGNEATMGRRGGREWGRKERSEKTKTHFDLKMKKPM